MNISIPIIATGDYIKYVPKLIEGINKYFLPGHKKWIYVFTDYKKEVHGAMTVYQEHKPWPYPTLYRYNIFHNYFHSQQLCFDYYFYLDADMMVVDTVGDEILGGIVATIHPGFMNKRPEKFELDTKFLAKSYINPKLVKQYYCGGFNGGSKYLEIAKVITSWVNIDQKHHYTPNWHDESYLNKFLTINVPDIVLSPEYCMPETMRERRVYGIAHMKPKIIAITK